jgi:SAM-dependent methyltransferase
MPTRDRTGLDAETLLLLRAVRRTGVVDALTERAGTAEAVAAATDVDERTAGVVIRTLADLGFLKRVGDEYEITNRALGFLAKRDLRSIGRLPHALDDLDYLAALSETMATGEPPAIEGETLRNRLGAHAATDDAVVRACVTAAVHARPDAERVVDVAGGSGVYAREFARRGYDVTLVEEPDVLGVIEPSLAHEDVALAAGRPGDLPAAVEGADLVFGADLTHRRTGEANQAFVAAAAGVLSPGGVVVLTDAVRGRSPSAPRVAAVELARGRGDAHDEASYRGWLDDAGFESIRVRDVPGTDLQAVVGRRPES